MANISPDFELNVTEGQVYRPGDMLIITYPRSVTAESASMIRSRIKEILPGIGDVLILGHGAAISGYRPEVPAHPWAEYNASENTCHYPGCRLSESEH